MDANLQYKIDTRVARDYIFNIECAIGHLEEIKKQCYVSSRDKSQQLIDDVEDLQALINGRLEKVLSDDIQNQIGKFHSHLNDLEHPINSH